MLLIVGNLASSGTAVTGRAQRVAQAIPTPSTGSRKGHFPMLCGGLMAKYVANVSSLCRTAHSCIGASRVSAKILQSRGLHL